MQLERSGLLGKSLSGGERGEGVGQRNSRGIPGKIMSEAYFEQYAGIF